MILLNSNQQSTKSCDKTDFLLSKIQATNSFNEILVLSGMWRSHKWAWEYEIAYNESIHALLHSLINSDLLKYYFYFYDFNFPRVANIESVLYCMCFYYSFKDLKKYSVNHSFLNFYLSFTISVH